MKFSPGDIVCFFKESIDDPRYWWEVIPTEEYNIKKGLNGFLNVHTETPVKKVGSVGNGWPFKRKKYLMKYNKVLDKKLFLWYTY